MKLWEWWKSRRSGKTLRELGKTEKLALLLAAGLLLVLLSWPRQEEGEKAPEPAETVQAPGTEGAYEEQLERRLEAILSQVEGAGTVQVMVTFKDGGEKVLQENTSRTEKQVEETDSSGGVRSQTEYSYDSDTLLFGGSGSSGTPYVIQEMAPEVEGILVLADGAGSATVQSQIAEAVQALFPVEAHKIRVLKRGS